MNKTLARWWARLSLAQKFDLVGLGILIGGMVVVGWWVGEQIESGVIDRTSATTALYVENFIVTQLQELGEQPYLSPERAARLEELLATTPLGEEIVDIKIWGPDGLIVYGTDAGAVYPIKEAQARAWQGEVSSHISDLSDPENAEQRKRWSRLIETYTPMRIEGTDRVIAVAEFYQTVDALEREIMVAQRRSWLVVGITMLVMYLLMAGIVRRGSDTIARQRAELEAKVERLDSLLRQNQELHERIRRAATRTTTLNEQLLRRIGAELHDGPAQDLSLSLLRLDGLIGYPIDDGAKARFEAEVQAITESLERALAEMRSIASGLRLPELRQLPLGEVVARVVRTHRARTGTEVAVDCRALPEHPPLPVKITIFRVIQEGLANAFRHGKGVAQSVRVVRAGERVVVEVADGGPGFDPATLRSGSSRLGLQGMRERVESLGGVFRVTSAPRQGTVVRAEVPLEPDAHEADTSRDGVEA